MRFGEGKKDIFTIGSKTYTRQILKQFEVIMGYPPPKKVTEPLDPNDHPELDDSKLLSEEMKKKYWPLMSMLQWAVTSGRMGIHTVVMTMGRFCAEPCEGHLKQLEPIFGFLKYYKSCSIKFCTDIPDYSKFKEVDHEWKYVYGEAKEELPSKMLEPKGKAVRITAFCDANLLHDIITGQAVMGIILMLTKTPVDWMSKSQATVETAMYGSEIIAARVAVDQIIEWRYNLCMLGVPLADNGGLSYIFGDNKAVVDSASIPEYKLKKRHHALSFH